MSNFQDILHRHGSLSMVWLVGNGAGPARNLSRSTKARNIILNSNLVELCDLLLQVAVIPERLADDEDGYENFMDIKKLAILLYGLYEFYRHQLKAFKRRLDLHYEKIKWRVPQPLGLGQVTNIDLPARKKVRRNELMFITPTRNLVQPSFGEFNIDDDPVLAGTPREANLGEPLPVQTGGDDLEPVDIARVDIIDAINVATASKRKRRHTGDRKQDANGVVEENDLLQWLGQNPNTANKRDITIREDDFIATSPRTIALEQDDFPFEDLESGASLGFNIPMEPDFDDVQQQPDMAEVTEPADTGCQNIIFDENLQEPQSTTPLRPAIPVQAVPLAQQIQADGLSNTEPPSNEPTRKRRGRAQNQGVIVDNRTQLSKVDLQAHIRENQRATLGSVDLARVFQSHDVQLTNLGTGKKAVELLQNHLGRGLGKALTGFVNQNQKMQLNLDSREVELRRSEISGHPEIPSSLNVIPEEESVNNLERHAPELHEGRSTHGIITSGIEERTLLGGTETAEPDAMDLPHQDLRGDMVVAEEIASPGRNNEFGNRIDEDEYVPVQQISVAEVDSAGERSPGSPTEYVPTGPNYMHGDSRTFRERCPPGTTRKGAAALEFFRILKLQKMKKVKLEQEVFYGPIYIKPLPQNKTEAV